MPAGALWSAHGSPGAAPIRWCRKQSSTWSLCASVSTLGQFAGWSGSSQACLDGSATVSSGLRSYSGAIGSQPSRTASTSTEAGTPVVEQPLAQHPRQHPHVGAVVAPSVAVQVEVGAGLHHPLAPRPSA
ncbi:hypothetical protein [Nonomuraea dietziae]|uniref:hypothetical protein n=1 Tax=Nonomuraea dietziae TaxID=65515 RepID=UPI0031D1DC15